MRKTLFVILVITLVITIAVILQRHTILAYVIASEGAPELSAPTEEGPATSWFDDYFTVQALDDRTFAIGEPRYYQQNFSYLIIGSERAVLFDAGPGLRDIRPVVKSLTDKPITFIPSHFHYDHVGNEITFEHVAVIDLPYLRARAPDNQLQLTFDEHVGVAEGYEAPILKVDEWLAHDSTLSLGDRTLQVLYTPGHTEDSISLLEPESGLLFSGDFIYPGPLFAFLANSHMGDYVYGAENMLSKTPANAKIFGAHRDKPPGAPTLSISDVEDLLTALKAVREGKLQGIGVYPVTYPVNNRIQLLVEPAWLQNWESRHDSN
ncbi:MAG: MBL fold metallo-hydrolase [Pseudomonadota bacterium]